MNRNRLTQEDRQRGMYWCRELKLEILRHQHKKSRSPREMALIEARAKLLKRPVHELGGVC